jgi:hypothetical protein
MNKEGQNELLTSEQIIIELVPIFCLDVYLCKIKRSKQTKRTNTITIKSTLINLDRIRNIIGIRIKL